MRDETRMSSSILKWPNRYKVLLIGVLIILIVYIMFKTGGSRTSLGQLFHIPIVLSTYFWRTKGGVLTGLISGIIAGPFMPLSVQYGIMQTPGNWILRIIVYVLVGGFIGYVFSEIDKLYERMREKDLTNPFTGLYNRNMLLMDIKKMIDDGQEFTILSIKLENFDSVGKYVDTDLIQNLVNQLVMELMQGYEDNNLYSYNDDEFILITYSKNNYLKFIEKLIDKYSSSFKIDDFEVRLVLKVGVYDYYGGNDSPSKLLAKARIAYEQADEQEYGIYYYNDIIEKELKATYEISTSLLDAVKNNELYLVYQPKINLKDNTIAGVEILSRWDRGDRKPVGPDVFIEIAEKIGLIKEISNYVLENTFNQIAQWESMNIAISYAFNVTAVELLEVDFIKRAEELIESCKLEGTTLEIELTERVLCQEGERLNSTLLYLRSLGYKVAVDDFGTGYNSLSSIMEIPFDILKIDKYFIERLDRIEVREMIRGFISYAHKFNKIVVAEGVETKEELDYIKELDCDMAQGFYLSKPLLAKDLEKLLL